MMVDWEVCVCLERRYVVVAPRAMPSERRRRDLGRVEKDMVDGLTGNRQGNFVIADLIAGQCQTVQKHRGTKPDLIAQTKRTRFM